MIPANAIPRNNWLVTRCWSPHSVLSERDPAALLPSGRSAARRDSKCSRLGRNAPSTNTKQAAPELSHHHSRKAKSRNRHHRQSSENGSSSSSSSGTSSSLSSESSNSDARRKKRKSKRHKRHKRHSKSQDSSFLNTPFTTMVPTPSRREVRWIKRGKYAHFEKLLSSLDDPSSLPGGKQEKGKNMRQVCDLAGWKHGTSSSLFGSRSLPRWHWSW